jgi:fructokinase
VIIELLDPKTASHTFAFTRPGASEPYPPYAPIEAVDVARAADALKSADVFYADRLSAEIVKAMEIAASAGAIVHFEPSSVGDRKLFARAVRLAHIFKFSVDRIPADTAELVDGSAFAIVTAGACGLDVLHGGRLCHASAKRAENVVDTCGSGDMVTVGLLDRLLEARSIAASPDIGIVLEGVEAGQRLAAANCAHVGARGLFRELGAGPARATLVDGVGSLRQPA